MATATLTRVRTFGPAAAGTRMTPQEFDRANFLDGYRYELIKGVLVVSPIPSEKEREPNGQLEYLLRDYKMRHPQGSCLDATLTEQTVHTGRHRRRADRVIWVGLGRKPKRNETPSVIAEFVSAAKRDRVRDYEEKRDEYMAIRVQEYWIIDRFQRTLTVFTRVKGKIRKRVFQEDQIYTTDLLPGFELRLAELLAVADEWPEPDEDEDEL